MASDSENSDFLARKREYDAFVQRQLTAVVSDILRTCCGIPEPSESDIHSRRGYLILASLMVNGLISANDVRLFQS